MTPRPTLFLTALALSATPAAAQAVGPGLQDLPGLHAPASPPTPSPDDTAPATARASRPLGAPPADAAPEPRRTALTDPDAAPRAPAGGVAQTGLALAGVLAIILGLAWAYKRAARSSGGLSGSLGAGGRAPAGLVEVLARYPLAARHTLVVLRFDRRVLLCSMTGSSRAAGAGMSVLCELTEPEDVASVLVKARDAAGESIARSFERSLRAADRGFDPGFDPARPAQPAAPVRINRPAAPDSDASGTLRRGLEAIWTGGRR